MFNMGKTWTCFWRVALPYSAFKGENNTQRRERRKRDREVLIRAGFNTEYQFKFRNTDSEKVSLRAKAKAEAKAAEISARTGLKMEVNEGSYL